MAELERSLVEDPFIFEPSPPALLRALGEGGGGGGGGDEAPDAAAEEAATVSTALLRRAPAAGAWAAR